MSSEHYLFPSGRRRLNSLPAGGAILGERGKGETELFLLQGFARLNPACFRAPYLTLP